MRKLFIDRTIHNKRGFTLVEIMVVVVIIGIVLSMVIPSFKKIRMASENSRLRNDIRTIAESFSTYTLEYGLFPNDTGPGVIPPEMVDHIPTAFTSRTPIGGQYDWEYDALGITAGVSVTAFTVPIDQIEKFDEDYDNGDTGSGVFQLIGGDRYTFIIAE